MARQGEFETAERLATEAVALTEHWEQDDSTAEVLADHAYVLRLAGKETEARRQANQALTRYQGKGNLIGVRRMQSFLEKARPTGAFNS